MSMTTRRRAGLLLGLCIAVAVSASTMASADEIADLKEKVQEYTVRLGELEKKDNDLQSAIGDIKLTQLWINEAQAQIIKEEEETAKRYLRRVEISLAMIDAVIETAKVEKTAFERESAAIAMEKEAFESKANLEKAELEERKLMQEVTAGSDKSKEGSK